MRFHVFKAPGLMLAAILLSGSVIAGDFDWIKDLNVQARLDPQGVKLTVASQLNIEGVELDLVWSNTNSAGDAAAVLALADASGRPVRDVLNAYQSKHQQGWGQMARELGIKPGSSEFHRLKSGYYDLGKQGKGK